MTEENTSHVAIIAAEWRTIALKREFDGLRYTGTAVFRHVFKDKNRIPQYEERTTLVAASNEEDAEKKLCHEFSEYATEGVVFLGVYEINETYDSPGEQPIEVASHMRVTSMLPDDFIDSYWADLRPRSCGEKSWKHVWYKKDEELLGCYNCKHTKKSTLK